MAGKIQSPSLVFSQRVIAMTDHQNTTRIDAAAVQDFIGRIIKDTARVTTTLKRGPDKTRLIDAIEVLRLARSTFSLAIEMLVPFDAD